MSYSITSYIGRFESDYVCEKCGALIYHANSPMNGYFCFTEGCENRLPEELEIIEPTRSAAPRLFADIDSLRSRLVLHVSEWDWSFVARHLQQHRQRFFLGFLKGEPIRLDMMLAMDRLLVMISDTQPAGKKRNAVEINKLIAESFRLNTDESQLEDFGNGRLVIAKDHKNTHENDGFFALDLLYLRSYYRDLELSGLANEQGLNERGVEGLFTFEDIDFANFNIESEVPPDDLIRELEPFAPTGVALDRYLNGHLWSKKMYKHMRIDVAFSVLFSWYKRLSDLEQLHLESSDDLEALLTEFFVKNCRTDYTGADFIDEYVDSTEMAPFAVRVPDGISLGKISLFFMCLILYVQEVPPDSRKSTGYSSVASRYAELRSQQFPYTIADELKTLGFSIPILNKVIRFSGVEREFDLIAVNEERSIVYLIEAKYKDVAPSSTTAATLIPNELEGEKGMLFELGRHQERLELFNSDPKRMAQRCRLERDLSEYRVEALIVSRSMPLLSRLDSIQWLRSDNFFEIVRSADHEDN